MYLSTVCMFAKLISSFMFIRSNPLAGVIYVLFCLFHIAFLPEPAYKGPDLVTYFRGNLDEELNRDRRITWLIEFYAAWQPSCVNFANTFAELSAKYTLDNLKFGKVDATRFPQLAEKYRVNTSSWTKQLPTLILFQNGKEVRRRPVIDGKGNIVVKFIFSEENIVRDFELNDLYHQCKKNPIKKKKCDLNKDAQKANGDAKAKEE
jgi:thiol-disulfide isomerase/thioredoxin